VRSLKEIMVNHNVPVAIDLILLYTREVKEPIMTDQPLSPKQKRIARQNRLAAAGLCVKCGRNPPKANLYRCQSCITKQVESNKALKAKKEVEILNPVTPDIPIPELPVRDKPTTTASGLEIPVGGLSI
jgi:hypothetical protein